MPYNPNMIGTPAKANNPNTFSNFEMALARYEAGGFDGLGIGIFNGISAIDIDNCVDANGQLSEMAQDIVRRMDSYTEYSPSGRGIRIVFLAPDFEYDKQYYIINREIGLEVYIAGSTSKYVTITGNVIRDVPVRDCSEELRPVLETYMRHPPSGSNARKTFDRSSMASIVEKAPAAQNGGAFDALWNGLTTPCSLAHGLTGLLNNLFSQSLPRH